MKAKILVTLLLFSYIANGQTIAPSSAYRGQSLITTITPPGALMTISSGLGSSYNFSLEQGSYVIPAINYTFTSSGLGFATSVDVTFVIPFNALQGFYTVRVTNSMNQWFNMTMYNSFQVFETRMGGKVFFDENQNGIYDSLDQPMANQRILVNPLSSISITDINGDYNIYSNSGYYSDSLLLPPNFINTTPSSYNFNIPPAVLGLDFGIYTPPSATLLHQFVSDVSRIRCFRPSSAFWEVSSQSHNIQNGKLTLIKSNDIEFLGSSLAPTLSTGDTIIWNYSLLPFERLNVQLILTDTSLSPAPNVLLIDSLFDQAGSFISASENHYNSSILCSYDPNEKTVSPEGDGPNHNTLKSEELFYTIRFQNCGNDTAFSITIRDTLSPFLDVSTFHILYSSSPVLTQIESGNRLRFTFNEIMLPDSNVDELHSHGEIIYGIRPLVGVADNSLVQNRAAIYFDFNLPIFTNQTFNTLQSQISTGLPSIDQPYNLNIYPNPVTNQSEIYLPDHENYQMKIYNISGQLILDKILSQNFFLKAESLEDGIYFARLTNLKTNQFYTGKFIVIKN